MLEDHVDGLVGVHFGGGQQSQEGLPDALKDVAVQRRLLFRVFQEQFDGGQDQRTGRLTQFRVQKIQNFEHVFLAGLVFA